MEIKAKCKYDYEACKAVAYISSYRKSEPKKTIIVRFIFVAVIMALDIYLMNVSESSFVNILYLLCGAFIILLDLFMYFVMPTVQYKSMSKMKELENEYVFYDDEFTAECTSEEYSGRATVRYSLLIKVFETKKYFFLYENKRQIFVVDKSTAENGDLSALRQRLSALLGKKYIICKY